MLYLFKIEIKPTNIIVKSLRRISKDILLERTNYACALSLLLSNTFFMDPLEEVMDIHALINI